MRLQTFIPNFDMRVIRCIAAVLTLGLVGALPAGAQKFVLEPDLVHLRSGDAPEWAEFAPLDPDSVLSISFDASANETSATLELTQDDVKRRWRIQLNGIDLGTLQPASIEWDPHVIGVTGAVWIDVDGDGRPTWLAGRPRHQSSSLMLRFLKYTADSPCMP